MVACTKNGELKPENFKIGSDKIVWWKCHKGHEWRTNIYHRQETGCPECLKERFTSFPEQAIFYYLKRAFNDVYNRYMLDERIELDIYIPEYRIAIEYDGAKFHNINLFNLHISHINTFLSTTLYSKNKNELKTILDDMRQKQLDWWEGVKSEENNNHSSKDFVLNSK